MLIHTMIDPRIQGQQTEVFEDLIDMYTCRQTCAMLLQIIVDRDAFYSFSRKVEEMLLNTRRKDNLLAQPVNTASKVSMMFRGSKRTSRATHTAYPQGEIKDNVIFRKVSQEAVILFY